MSPFVLPPAAPGLNAIPVRKTGTKSLAELVTSEKCIREVTPCSLYVSSLVALPILMQSNNGILSASPVSVHRNGHKHFRFPLLCQELGLVPNILLRTLLY